MNREKTIELIDKSLIKLVRKIRHEVSNVIDEDLTRNQIYVLGFLDEHGKQKVSAIAKEFEVSSSHITSLTDDLVKKGLVDRARSEQDRRVVELTLTTEGKKMLTDILTKKRAYFKRKMDTYSNSELDSFLQLLDKFQDEGK